MPLDHISECSPILHERTREKMLADRHVAADCLSAEKRLSEMKIFDMLLHLLIWC